VSRRASFTQSDVTRAVKGAQAAGLIVSRVEVDGDKIIVLTAAEAAERPKSAVEAWRDKRNGTRAAEGH
jgi:hypothetical protein